MSSIRGDLTVASSDGAEVVEGFVRVDLDRAKELTTLEREKGFRERGSEGSRGVVSMMEDLVEELGGEMGEVVAV